MKTFSKALMFGLILMLFLNGMQCISQDNIFILQPASGEILGMNEITYYTLFQEISNAKFEDSFLEQAADAQLKSYFFPDFLLIRQLDTSEICWFDRNYIKMVAYYLSFFKIYTNREPGMELKSIVIKDNNSYQINNNILVPGIIEGLRFEYIYNERAQEMINYSKIRQLGIDPCPLNLDFNYWKKKK
jgi:hypothetical protein